MKAKPKIIKPPIALFDQPEYIGKNTSNLKSSSFHVVDYNQALSFLKAYNGSYGTFNAYRREVERLLHWSWLIAKKSIKDLKRDDIENFIKFCQKPPKEWIGLNRVSRFIEKEGVRIPNPKWRPFVAHISKMKHKDGEISSVDNYVLSSVSVKEIFAILGSFYNFLLQEEYAIINPVALIRQKSKFVKKNQGKVKIRRLSELQWQYLIETVTQMADAEPDVHERSLFIISALYSMYLRISELVASDRWTPLMKNFYKDNNNHWWFLVVGKGNKERDIAVSNSMLAALKRWRKHLGLSPLPSPSDNSPIFPRTKGIGPLAGTAYIRKIVQHCFDKTIERLNQDRFKEDAELLTEATVHWLRHTGISDDVKRRPREHVRDDAGHSSSATTDKYIDIQLQERYRSARDKPISE